MKSEKQVSPVHTWDVLAVWCKMITGNSLICFIYANIKVCGYLYNIKDYKLNQNNPLSILNSFCGSNNRRTPYHLELLEHSLKKPYFHNHCTILQLKKCTEVCDNSCLCKIINYDISSSSLLKNIMFLHRWDDGGK